MSALASRLERYGLARHAALFAEHGIDLDVLPELTDGDLEKLGLPLGERIRILKAAKAIAAEPATPAASTQRSAERRQLTVVFADLVDSTRLAAMLDPEDMRAVIGAYQSAVGQEVRRFGGTVAKPLGDGLLIYFGWPQAHEDDAERSVRAALAAIAAVRTLRTPGGDPLAMRLGIATGEVVVGDFVGEGVDEAGAVVGETPNLAARLQSLAEPNTVVIADATLKLVGAQFACADLGGKTVKGFDEPVRVWRVDGERATESRFHAFHGGSKLGKLVGRDHEVGFIMDRWQQSRDGEGQLVLVSGEAGLGKSRLLAEVESRVGEDAAARIFFQASPLHMNTALYPVTRQIETAAAVANTTRDEEREAALRTALPATSDRDLMALHYIGGLMSVPSLGGSVEGTASAEEAREAAFGYLVDRCAALALQSPLLVAVEDAHWLDATSLEFLDRLIARLEESAALTIVTYRPEFVAPWGRRTNAGLLTLGRLGRRQVQAIVAALAGNDGGIPQELVEQIVAKSDGVPLFVEELTGSALDAEPGSGRVGEIPATLKDSLTARLDRLGSAKEVAQAAAAIGREFSASMLADILDRRPDEIADDLKRLTAIEVLFPRPDNRFIFKHALVQDAAYESMLKSRRREIHTEIVRSLERERPHMAEAEPEVLAEHLARAGNLARAAECWRRAGNLALSRSAYREAIGAFSNALPLFAPNEHAARADVHRALVRAYFPSGEHRMVREHLELAATDAEAAGDQVMVAEIALQQGHDLIQYGGSLADAIHSCERALEIAKRLNDETLACGARFSIGQARWITGSFAEAIRVLEQNLPENLIDPERIRDVATAGSTIMDSVTLLAASHAYRGEFDAAFAYLDRAGGLMTRASAFDFSVVQAHLNRARLQRGEAAIALPALEKAVKHAIEFGVRFLLPWLRGMLGYSQALIGATDVALASLNLAVEEARQIGAAPAEIAASSFLAETLLVVDEGSAGDVATKALATARANGYRAQETELLRITGAADTARDHPKALAVANEGLALARSLGMRPEEGHALRCLGDIHAKAGDSEAAAEHRSAARAIYSDLGMSYWLERLAS